MERRRQLISAATRARCPLRALSPPMRGGAARGAPPLLLLGALLAACAPAPAHAVIFEAGFQCPPAATTNTSCLCTSGCSINSEFSYLWSAPQYPPPSRGLGTGARAFERGGALRGACADARAVRRHHLRRNHAAVHARGE